MCSGAWRAFAANWLEARGVNPPSCQGRPPACDKTSEIDMHFFAKSRVQQRPVRWRRCQFLQEKNRNLSRSNFKWCWKMKPFQNIKATLRAQRSPSTTPDLSFGSFADSEQLKRKLQRLKPEAKKMKEMKEPKGMQAKLEDLLRTLTSELFEARLSVLFLHQEF